MFGLFKSKHIKPKPTVTPEDKEWVEEQLLWMIKAFGLDHLKQRPFILPEEIDNFTSDMNDPVELQKLIEQLCGFLKLDPAEIELKLFDDLLSKQWTDLAPTGTANLDMGTYQQEYTTEQKRFIIRLAKSGLSNPGIVVNVMAHELAHVKLLGGNHVRMHDADMEPLTDLAVIHFGFGLFIANYYIAEISNYITKTGYLPGEVIAYANALICFVTEHKATDHLKKFNSNTRELFEKNSEFLLSTGDTELKGVKVKNAEKHHHLEQEIMQAFDKRRFEKVIPACRELLEMSPDDNYLYNNMGYALLQQKKYEEAIDMFTKGIEIEPYSDYPFNNRGYCKLQLGDADNAFADLDHSYQMNPDNSYAWRNLGAFYLATGDPSKALEYFEQARKMDPKTEMIYFYLSHAHAKLGDGDKAREFARLSRDANEYNDSNLQTVDS